MKRITSTKKVKNKPTKTKLSSRKQKSVKRGSTYQILGGRRPKGSRSKQIARNIKLHGKPKQPRRASSSITPDKRASKSKIVRIMGHGQYSVDNKTLKRLNEIDNLLVRLVNTDRPNDNEFKKHLMELTTIVEKNGQQLHPKQIIQSDIILPSADLSIDEAKRLFIGEGVMPEI